MILSKTICNSQEHILVWPVAHSGSIYGVVRVWKPTDWASRNLLWYRLLCLSISPSLYIMLMCVCARE
jgi:hypothetical protein